MLTKLPIVDDLGLSRPFRIGVDITLFVISLYFLERAADVFVDSTAVVGKRFGVPTILVGLLTAGAEWEEVSWQRRAIAERESMSSERSESLAPHATSHRSLLPRPP